MPDSEIQLGVIKDILLPLDAPTRYDVYFTDKRIAIVCMGHSNRFDEVSASRSFLFGIAPDAASTHTNDKRIDRQMLEAQINALPLEEKLKLSKKSCLYTYEEIEEVKLIPGKKPKFTILSEECISKFAPNEEQFKHLTDLLPTIEMLKDKLSIFNNLELKAPEAESAAFFCKYCGSKNDADALFCESCGKQIETEIKNPAEVTCVACGAKNRVQASFCKKCGTSLHA